MAKSFNLAYSFSCVRIMWNNMLRLDFSLVYVFVSINYCNLIHAKLGLLCVYNAFGGWLPLFNFHPFY